MDAFLGSYSGKLEAVSGDLGVDVSEIAANNSSTLGLEAVAVKTRDLFSDYLNQLMVQDYTLAEENSLSFLDTIMENKEDTFQITDPSQQSNEEVSQEEVMVNEETKEVDKMEEETQTNGEDNGTEVINPEIADVELPAKKRVVKNKAGLPGVNSRKRNPDFSLEADCI
ncbi:AT4g07380 [Arabidopsis thaliana]|uniref:AT4g07380 protein n=3 Tax=Arabidopsis thaliana TaxID=3702 RepID=Q9S9X6_ARATH|nr:uncharacterized protein AT4G07380 [Arabidopsis thaliana]AAD48938.1 F28D6.12 gene product [Arabidopsis thaliana]AEE82563.1 hypothetical protein AT4G07380 [Arabidopsis thaliana]CAB81108.1 AT4g07380 [Arabidopsis thaliana]VYS61940.1 unnamed protein product [Arabidopsis thaliana]|eukprot:NP_567314.1 hypothetical protein AT4G07380 [Arabidopsis thaliana]